MLKRNPSWKTLGKRLESWVWSTEKITKNKIVFERGRQRIIEKNLPHTRKWKVEYYSGKVMDDVSGFEDEFFAKATATEIAIFK